MQNKVNLAQPLLPAEVGRQGITVAKASPDILLFIGLYSNNPSVDGAQLEDILASRIQPDIARIDGIGNTLLIGSEYAVRIWLDPAKLQA